MNTAQFMDWLRGFMAAIGDGPMTGEQRQRIVDELAKVTAAPERVQYDPYSLPTWPVTGGVTQVFTLGGGDS